MWIVDERLAHAGAAVLCDRLLRRGITGEVLLLVSLGGVHDLEPALAMVERGAAAVVDVNCSWSILVKGVRAVADGDIWLPRRIESGLLKSMLQARATDDAVIRSLLRLTDRERDVLLLLCRGMNRVEVAEALHISGHTARTHVQRVIEKLGVHSQREVLALGLKHRLAERFDRSATTDATSECSSTFENRGSAVRHDESPRPGGDGHGR